MRNCLASSAPITIEPTNRATTIATLAALVELIPSSAVVGVAVAAAGAVAALPAGAGVSCPKPGDVKSDRRQ
jgi:hypothetical protein